MNVSHIIWVILAVYITAAASQYKPNWESLDSRPLPDWYDKSKVGLFVHWSVNSVPAYGAGGTACRFWLYWSQGNKKIQEFLAENYPPGWTYQNFASQFRAEFFDPDEWAHFFEDIGVKYVVLVTKHHEGWNNWKSRYQWDWNAVDEGPHRDIVGDLAQSVRNLTKLHFGLYYSLPAWFHPYFQEDIANNYTTNNYATEVSMPMLKEMVEKYKPEVLWVDGVRKGVTDKYWDSLNFLTWLYNQSPVKDYVVTNDRWGYGDVCKHGGFLTCGDRHNPKKVLARKWESCMTIDEGSWCYNRGTPLSHYMSSKSIIHSLISVVSCGGNFLLNFGPTHDGRIMPVFQERLRDMGAWLKINGESIYESSPWDHQNDTVTKNVWYTTRLINLNQTYVYAHVLNWPPSGILTLDAVNASGLTDVYMFGYPDPLKWVPLGPKGGMNITMSVVTFDKLPNPYAWTLKISNTLDAKKKKP